VQGVGQRQKCVAHVDVVWGTCHGSILVDGIDSRGPRTRLRSTRSMKCTGWHPPTCPVDPKAAKGRTLGGRPGRSTAAAESIRVTGDLASRWLPRGAKQPGEIRPVAMPNNVRAGQPVGTHLLVTAVDIRVSCLRRQPAWFLASSAVVVNSYLGVGGGCSPFGTQRPRIHIVGGDTGTATGLALHEAGAPSLHPLRVESWGGLGDGSVSLRR
jgi:hypothetical protein